MFCVLHRLSRAHHRAPQRESMREYNPCYTGFVSRVRPCQLGDFFAKEAPGTELDTPRSDAEPA